jgi:HK97 family phage major capsid protein
MANKSVTEAINSLEVEIKNNVNARIDEMRAEHKSALDAIEKAAGRPTVSAADAKDAEHKTAFTNYLRSGDKAIMAEFKTMTAGSATDGGVTVPKSIYNVIQKQLVDISPMRSVARVLSVATPDFHIPYSKGGTTSGWVGESDVRGATNTSSIVEIVPNFGELYALPVVSNQLVEDSQFDINGYVAGEAATEFARAEGAAFLNGTGVKQPIGILAAPFAATADKTRAFGTAQSLTSSVVGGMNADDLIAMTGALKAGFRANAKWLMTKATKTAIRSLKDSYGQYLLVTSLVAGTPDTLLGYPIVEMEDMPEIGAGNLSVLFGDFAAGYTICDRVGATLLVNPYLTPGFVTYQWRMRVGGAVVDTQAFKALKIKAS